MKIIIFLGGPGSGKGTQAEKLAAHTKYAHISTGELFRTHLKNQTEIGKKVKDYIDRAVLVPDEIVMEMLKTRLQEPDCTQGAVLDGVPRTMPQAESLDKMATALNSEISSVLYIHLSTESMLKRVTGRWTCKANGHVYHEIHNPSKQAGICDFDNSELYQRAEDTPQTQQARINEYLEKTTPLIDYYKAKGTLIQIDGEPDIETVTNEIISKLS